MVATLGIVAAYLAVPGAARVAGALDRYDARPPPALLVPVVLFFSRWSLALSPWGKRVAVSVGVRALVASTNLPACRWSGSCTGCTARAWSRCR